MLDVSLAELATKDPGLFTKELEVSVCVCVFVHVLVWWRGAGGGGAMTGGVVPPAGFAACWRV